MSLVKRNIIANFISNGWTAVIALALVPLYIKFLGIESYGLVGFFVTLQSVFSLFDMGLSTTLNRELARLSTQQDKQDKVTEARDLVRTLEILNWIVAAFIALSITLLSPLLAAHWFKSQNLSPATIKQVLLLMSLVVALQFPFTVYTGGLLGLQRQVLLGGFNAVMATVRGLGAGLILWLVSPTIQAFFIWQIAVSFIQTTLGAYLLWGQLPAADAAPRFNKELLLGMWHFAAGMTGISVVALLLTQADKIILSKILTLEKFGYYTVASTVAAGLYVIAAPIFSAVFPRLSQMVSHNDEDSLIPFYHKSCQTMSVLLLPTAIVVSLFAPEILRIWTRDELIVKNSHLIVSLLIVGTALNGLMNIPYALQLAHGWTKLVLYQGVISLILLIPLLFWASAHYGAIGAAVIWILVEAGYVLIGIQIMHKWLLPQEKWKWYSQDIGMPLIGALGLGLLMRWLYPSSAMLLTSLAWIVATLIMAIICAAVSSPYIRDWIKHELSNSWPMTWFRR